MARQRPVYEIQAQLSYIVRARDEQLQIMRSSKRGMANYDAAKKKYDEFDAQYKTVQKELSAAKSAVETKKATEKEQKDLSTREARAKAKEKEADLAEDTGNAALAATLRSEAAEIRNPKPKPGVDPNTGKTVLTDEQSVANLLATARISEAPGGPVMQWSSPNTLNPKGDPVVNQGYIYVEPATKRDERIPSVIAKPSEDKGVALETSDVARDKYEAQLVKQYGKSIVSKRELR